SSRQTHTLPNAPATTATALRPLTPSSLRSEPIDLESRARCARSRSSRLAPSLYVLQHITGVRSCLCTRSPSAVSGQCQRFQRPLASLGPVLFEVARSALAPAPLPSRNPAKNPNLA